MLVWCIGDHETSNKNSTAFLALFLSDVVLLALVFRIQCLCLVIADKTRGMTSYLVCSWFVLYCKMRLEKEIAWTTLY